MTLSTLSERPQLATLSTRKLICINLVMIAFMDSFVMWNDPLIGKLFTYALKLLNIGGLALLASQARLEKYIWTMLVLPLAWIVWDESSFPASLQYFYSATLPVATFLLLRDEEQAFVLKLYLKLVAVLYIPGILIYLTINFVPLPFITYTRSLDNRNYENYFFLYYSLSHIHFRFFSIFDEPGVVGSLAAIVTFYYRQFLSRREYILFVISGFLSFSLFFLVCFFPVYYFSNIRFLTVWQKVKKSIIAIGAIAIFYFSLIFFLNQIKDDPILSYALYHRFKWENGFIVGVVSNRDVTISGFADAYEAHAAKGGLNFWIGKGKNSVVNEFGNSSLSYRVLLYEKGLALVLYIMLLVVLMHPWRRQTLFSFISVAFLCLLIFQRPLIFKIDYFILIYFGVKLASQYAKEKNSSYNTQPA